MYLKKFQTIRSTNLDITISIFYTYNNPKSAMKLPIPYGLNAPYFKLSKEEICTAYLHSTFKIAHGRLSKIIGKVNSSSYRYAID